MNGHNDPIWQCTAELENGVRLGTTDVVCEGYRDRDDPYVLRGSCGLEYTLVGSPVNKGTSDQNNQHHNTVFDNVRRGFKQYVNPSAYGSYLNPKAYRSYASYLNPMSYFRNHNNPYDWANQAYPQQQHSFASYFNPASYFMRPKPVESERKGWIRWLFNFWLSWAKWLLIGSLTWLFFRVVRMATQTNSRTQYHGSTGSGNQDHGHWYQQGANAWNQFGDLRDRFNTYKQDRQTDDSSSNFWQTLGLGALSGYLFGRGNNNENSSWRQRQRQRQYNAYADEYEPVPSDRTYGSQGYGRVVPPPPSVTINAAPEFQTATGYGTTKRREPGYVPPVAQYEHDHHEPTYSEKNSTYYPNLNQQNNNTHPGDGNVQPAVVVTVGPDTQTSTSYGTTKRRG
jgi:hypothetical protein